MQSMAASLRTATSHFNRWRSAQIEKDVFDELRAEGVETLDVALEAQRRLSQAEIAFYTSVTEYNKMLALLHRRKGTILAYSGIHFEEGPWAGKAYLDASEHARRRSASRPLNYGWSRPEVISRGEDYPSNSNIGYKVGSATTAPVTYADPMADPMAYPSGVETVPYNAPIEIQHGEGMIPSTVESLVPTPAEPVILPPVSQAQPSQADVGNVRLVAYEAEVQSPPQRKTLKAQSTRQVQPRVNRVARRLAVSPLRDETLQKDAGIRNAKRVPRPEAIQHENGAERSKTIPANPVRMNWSQVGAEPSQHSNQVSTATIGRIITRDSGDN